MAKSKRKGRKAGVFFLFVLIGVGIGTLFLFRQEIANLFKPGEIRRPVVKQQKNIVLYFSDEGGEYLVAEKDKITRKEKVEQEAKEMIEELIRGPKGRLVPTLPRKTRLLNFHLEEKGLARVSFSKDLTAEHPGGSSAEIMTVYSIVNSLTANFPQIRRVQILIEGKEIETIAGHLSLRRPLSSKSDLIRNH